MRTNNNNNKRLYYKDSDIENSDIEYEIQSKLYEIRQALNLRNMINSDHNCFYCDEPVEAERIGLRKFTCYSCQDAIEKQERIKYYVE